MVEHEPARWNPHAHATTPSHLGSVTIAFTKSTPPPRALHSLHGRHIGHVPARDVLVEVRGVSEHKPAPRDPHAHATTPSHLGSVTIVSPN